MRSTVLYTEEIDEMNVAAEEIFEQAESFNFGRSSLALIFTEEDVDYPELYRHLRTKWDFPMIGSTAMGTLLGKQGYCGGGISVMILSADDCTFSVGMAQDLDRKNYEGKITEAFQNATSSLDGDPKLVLIYACMITGEGNVSGDEMVAIMDKLMKGAPVYGGLSSDDFNFDHVKVFCNDRVDEKGLVMATISGNIDPKFVHVNSVKNKASFSYEVTKSDDNRVIMLGDRTFVDALKKEDMETDKEDVLADYILSPFVLSIDGGDGDKVEVGRVLASLNKEDGSGLFYGLIPEGTVLNIGLLNKEDVQSSVERAFDEILKLCAGRSTLMCTSCCARFVALGANSSSEPAAYQNRLPAGTTLGGMYAYGEFCPVKGSNTGKEYNMFHNFTFTILAI
ncbi:MAG: FIST C-terminal domain-containing protein [Lachnospiraceae bacterium]|nr:FIST C-terminal domain-containing protein [Lachnospiraceae bacterium]